MAKIIQLTQGKQTVVDDDVYEWASEFKWYAHYRSGSWYACRNEGKRPNRKTILLHREIAKAPPGVRVDHQDTDSLNNRSENLRPATQAENGRNRGPQANNTSGYKGVGWYRASSKWAAGIKVSGKRIHLGYFHDIIEAAKAYDKAAKEHFGEFAWTNFD